MRSVTDKRGYEGAIGRAMVHYAQEHGPLDRVRHTVQMTSFGGSGSTAFSAHLAAAGVDLPTTPGEFPFRHQRFPHAADAVPDGFRVIYPFVDPRNAMLSIFRRGYIIGHYRGVHLRDPAPETEARLENLDAFLDGGVDEFGLEDHVARWMEPLGYPVMFVRFDSLPNVWPAVREFVSLGDDAPCLEMQSRASDWRSLPCGQQQALTEIYGPLVRRLDALPDVYVT